MKTYLDFFSRNFATLKISCVFMKFLLRFAKKHDIFNFDRIFMLKFFGNWEPYLYIYIYMYLL